MRKSKRKLLKTISLTILGLGVLGGVIAITNHFVRKGDVSIHPTFEVGGLDANGKYEDNKDTLYTKNKFACEGLKATLDFDSEINYQIFYYDILDNFISSTEVLSDGYNGDAPLNGAYARIEITPTNDGDGKISWTEKIKYSSQLNLKVAKGADGNVSKKFISYGGCLLEVVDNYLDSYFEYGYEFKDGKFNTTSHFSSTTKTLLKFNGGDYIRFNPSNVIGDVDFGVNIFEFRDLPTVDSEYEMVILNKTNNYTSITHKNAKYILLSVYCPSENYSTLISKLASAFTIQKNAFNN